MAPISASSRAAIFGWPGRVERTTVATPWGIRTTAHVLVAAHFLAACRDAAASSSWRPLRIDSYNPRPIRGFDGDELSEWSLHAWALAWDFFATPPGVPPPGGVWTPANPVPPEFAAAFERRGFRWGARFRRTDLPHIEWPGGRPAALLPPPPPPPTPAPAPEPPPPPRSPIMQGFFRAISTLPPEHRPVWISDGITRRWVVNYDQLQQIRWTHAGHLLQNGEIIDVPGSYLEPIGIAQGTPIPPPPPPGL